MTLPPNVWIQSDQSWPRFAKQLNRQFNSCRGHLREGVAVSAEDPSGLVRTWSLVIIVVISSVAFVRIRSHSRTTDSAALIYPGSADGGGYDQR